MRILGILVFILFGYVSSTYAEEDTHSAVIEQKNHDTADNLGDDASRIAVCEREIRQLTGRVEVLEHLVRELQKGQNLVSSAAAPDNQHAQSVPILAPTPPVTASTEIVQVTSPQDQEKEKRDYDMALASLKESNFAQAENMFSNFMQQYPNSPMISNAYFWYAESFYRRGDFDKAAVHYLKGYKQFPKSGKAADSLLKLALSLGEIKKTKEACVILHKLEEEFKQRPASSIKRAYDAKMKYGCK
jgi:tol-pal system protein YbgF